MSENMSNAPIFSLDVDSIPDGLTVFAANPSVNEFLQAEEGPFVRLREKMARSCGLVETLWGHTNPEKQESIGNMLDEAGITDDLQFERFLNKHGKSLQEVMKNLWHYHPAVNAKAGWQSWLKLQWTDSKEAAVQLKQELMALESQYPDRKEEAKAMYQKLLTHYADISMSKGEKEISVNEGMFLLAKSTATYTAQVTALSTYYNIGVAILGFIVDESLPPVESTIAFTSSHTVAEMVKMLQVPITQEAALAMCQLYDGLSTFRFEGERSSNKDVTLSHLMNENLGEDAEMKLEDVEVEVDEVDIHTPQLVGSLTSADNKFGNHSQRHTQCGALLKNLIGEAVGQKTISASWGTSKIFPFLLENHLHFKNWHRGVPLLNKKLPSSWSPCKSACCIVVLTHERLEIKLEVVKMTLAKEMSSHLVGQMSMKGMKSFIMPWIEMAISLPILSERTMQLEAQPRCPAWRKGRLQAHLLRRMWCPRPHPRNDRSTVPEEIMLTNDLHSAKASNNATTAAQTKVEPENIPEAAAFNGLDLANILNDEIFVEASGDMADGG
ncbi:uncharacterized protein EI90DRAFT_3025057 [Cantharellus anzutake]|uniref:uncharacterized protein n=1 Tax=Cantharellus anzutake TaxID=1750568 RepID=UPI0019034D32|nr:uncharacterized protein EI90DRAFT_3025057 [Cantharellus anzutake]KAF8309530.1 hypothetical protein EI90DRAFT_3025057 [Cantharellus anzutake]